MRIALLTSLSFGLISILILATGCSTAKNSEAAATKVKIEFEFFYRKDQTVQHSATKKISFEIEVLSGDIPEIDRMEKSKSETVGEYKVVITPGLNSFYLDIFEQGKEPRQVLRQLFQIDSSIINQFAGSHGFTGLSYVYHSESKAELQYFGKVTQ